MAASTHGSSSSGESMMATSWLARAKRSAGSDAKAVSARCRSTRESPSTQSSSVPSSCSTGPVRRPSARAAWTHTSGSGCRSSGWSTWSVRPTSSGSALGGIPQTRHLEAARGEHATAQRAVRGPRIMASKSRRAPEPRAERGHLEGARAGLPDQDLQRARASRSPGSASSPRRRAAARTRARRAAAPRRRDRGRDLGAIVVAGTRRGGEERGEA
jgi:hypothetical protein